MVWLITKTIVTYVSSFTKKSFQVTLSVVTYYKYRMCRCSHTPYCVGVKQREKNSGMDKMIASPVRVEIEKKNGEMLCKGKNRLTSRSSPSYHRYLLQKDRPRDLEQQK